MAWYQLKVYLLVSGTSVQRDEMHAIHRVRIPAVELLALKISSISAFDFNILIALCLVISHATIAITRCADFAIDELKTVGKHKSYALSLSLSPYLSRTVMDM